MNATPDARIAAIASCQQTVFARWQALSVGFTDGMSRSRLDAGRWVRHRPGVYGLAGVPDSWLMQLWIAYLSVGPDAVITHQSAAALHKYRTFFPGPLVLTAPHGRHDRLPGGFVHQINDLTAARIEVHAGLPVASRERTVVDVASVLGPKRLFTLMDDVVTDRQTTDAKVGACLAEVARRGKPGVTKLASVLDERGPGYVPPASELERVFFAAVDAAGLPKPTRQLALPGRGAIEGLVDAGYVDVRLLMEVDGRRWHTRIRDIARDHLRDSEAARCGYQTLRFLFEHIVADPREVTGTIADVYASRAALFANSRT
jgi:hypothetical protein